MKKVFWLFVTRFEANTKKEAVAEYVKIFVMEE